MSDAPERQRFVLAEIDGCAVLVRSLSSEFIEAESWKDARSKVPFGAFAHNPGHGFAADELAD